MKFSQCIVGQSAVERFNMDKHLQTTLTSFRFCSTTYPPLLTVSTLWKLTFLDYLPTSSSNRSLWTTPFSLHSSRECVSTGAEGARTRRSLGHHLLHPHILRPRALFYKKRLHTKFQIPNTYPGPYQSKPMEFISTKNGNFLFSYSYVWNIFYLQKDFESTMHLFLNRYNVDSWY